MQFHECCLCFHSRKFFWYVRMEWSSKILLEWMLVAVFPLLSGDSLSFSVVSPSFLPALLSPSFWSFPFPSVRFFPVLSSFLCFPFFWSLAFSFLFLSLLFFPLGSFSLSSFPFLCLFLPFLSPFFPFDVVILFFVAFEASNWRILFVAIMVIMERSRSPTRTSLGNEPRPLVGFPVWTRPIWIRDTCTSTSAISKQLSMEPKTDLVLLLHPKLPYLNSLWWSLRDNQVCPNRLWTYHNPSAYPCTFMATSQGSYDNTSTCSSRMWDGWNDASISSTSSFVGPTDSGMAKTFSVKISEEYTDTNYIYKSRTISGRIPSIQFGQHWKSDEEFYDNQKKKLSKLLYQGSEDFWLRKLATGREVYVATMGEVNQVVFVNEILAQVRGRGIDLDRLSQNKALQDGLTVDKKEAIQHLTKLLVDQMQKWLPVVQADSGSQHQICCPTGWNCCTQSQSWFSASQEAPGPEGNTPPPPNRVQSPTEAAFQGHRPVAFDPAQLLVAPGGTNQGLENNMPESFSDNQVQDLVQNFELDINSRQNWKTHVAMDTWWQNQPEAWGCWSYHSSSCCLSWHFPRTRSSLDTTKPLESDDCGIDYDFVKTFLWGNTFWFYEVGNFLILDNWYNG